MRPIPLALAFVMVGGLVVVLPSPAQADTTPVVQPLPNSTTGRCNYVATSASMVLVAHYNTANQIVVAFSMDQGATWTNKATGIALGACTYLGVRLVDFDSWRFYYWTGGAAGALRVIASDDGGDSWTDTLLDNAMPLVGLPVYGGSSSQSATSQLWDFQSHGTDSFSYVFSWFSTSDNGCNNYRETRVEVVVRTWTGTAWRTAYRSPPQIASVSSCAAPPTIAVCSASLDLTDTAGLDGRVMWSTTTNGAVTTYPTRVTINNGAVQSSTTNIDDAFTALPSRTCQGRLIRGADELLIVAGSPATWYLMDPIGATTFQAISTAAPASAAGPYAQHALQSGPRQVFVVSESTNSPLILYSSCTDGTTWDRIPLYGTSGTYPSVAGMAPFGASGTVAVAFRYVDTLGYVKNTEPVCPGTPIGANPSGGSTATAYTLQRVFCSIRSNDRFGYNYKEGVQIFDSDLGDEWQLDIDHGYQFAGDTNNYDYLAKTFDPATASKGMRVVFRIESAQEATGESVFRAGFSFKDHVNAGWQNNDADKTLSVDAKGDGGDPANLPSSGAFEDYIEVRFEEENDDWEIRVFLYFAGVRYKLGTTAFVDDPDVANTYSFEVDTSASHPYYKVKRLVKETVNGQEIMVAKPISNGPLEKDLTVSAQPGVPEGPGLFPYTYPTGTLDAKIYSQWFTGHSTTISDAKTFLDNGNREETNPSTCIYDLYGAAEGAADCSSGTGAVAEGDQGANGPCAAPNGDVQVIDPESVGAPVAQKVSERSLGVQSVLMLIMTAGGAFLGWIFTGGRVERGVGKMPDIKPGMPLVVAGMAGVGNLVACFTVAQDMWIIPTLLTIAGVGFAAAKR